MRLAVEVDYEPEVFIVTCPAPANHLIQTIPGSKYRSGEWYVPGTMAGAAALSTVHEQLDTSLTPDAERRFSDLRVVKTWQEAGYTAHDEEKAYPFQQEGIGRLEAAGSVLLADEMGLGKTMQVIRTLDRKYGDNLRAVVICTKSMQYKWADEFFRWAPEITTVIVEGSAAQRRKQLEKEANVYIVTHDAAWRHSSLAGFGSIRLKDDERASKELNRPWDYVIVDEAHKIKDPKAKRTRAIWSIGRSASHRVAMTGTPVVNNPDDLWSIMHFVSPEEWPTRSKFRERYCVMREGFHGGYENLGLDPLYEDELHLFLDPRLIRRTKAEVLPDLPKKTYDTIHLPMDSKQAKAYQALRKEMLATIDEQLVGHPDPLVLAGMLRQAASAYPVPDGRGGIEALTTPSNKLDALRDIIAEHGPGVVVYAESKRLINMLAAELFNDYAVGLITGDVDPETRARVVEHFQSGHCDLVLGTLGAGAEGITLTRADLLVFAQTGWSNVQNKQAEDRIHRIGQEGSAHIVHLITADTLDEVAFEAAETKEYRLQQVVRDPDWWREHA